VKVSELIERLQRCDPDDPVVISGAGDVVSVGRSNGAGLRDFPRVVVTSRNDASLILPNPMPMPFWPR